MITAVNFIFYGLFILAMGYYLILNLQWYGYKLNRVLIHHTKTWWHFVYFLIPFVLFMSVSYASSYGFIVSIVYLALLFNWYRGLDKVLVWTGRVKRFYVAMIFFAIFITFSFNHFTVFIPLLLAYFVSMAIEKMLFNGFKVKAQKKLASIDDLIVIGITASYGKTSMKNYIEHILKAKYKTYATPHSVNTLGGVMKDVNDDLPEDTEVYVVEMGARMEGDIGEISTFVNPQYTIVGQLGPAHIEYFRSMENIRNTKMEILKTDRLKTAWVHESAMVKSEPNVHIFGEKNNLDIRNNIPAPKYIIEDVKATFDSTSFTLMGTRYTANILGAFNATNLAVSVLVAKELGLSDKQIQEGLSTLKSVPHRLQRIDAGGKVILDDSYNGNIDGMMASFALAASYEGRKVIITPGLVEVDDDLNIQVAKRANEVFDVVIVTGDLNYAIFKEYVDAEKLVKLATKAGMKEMLVEQTQVGDLILFANDAPSFV